ncbi:cytochrome c maturation protein CcmE [Flammeovirga yaeyamensis]|uniref:Cytochrome c maturation protein CcmE n=1 Tax=Flammeovirga yaeyamensis TaxID=367791 RepID=A0AAX1N5B9_9BACT|nr:MULTISPECIES: cytochrome c maturation protein CcmE [Flammeovirga]ANQ49794.1 cytochrome c maturation protein CcmE [Flammeovirga sp. MY04]MBB3697344.1 cytochrome c-type biogenesis protein CcmE [Flammeovirga yaeyamensis]NMF36038.1 cytochrome c maturation protein CcmE [Flammeovirga yaeyamensis]QWG02773.1 cytochrome c maturation protein CcmE [Flammeovirga yaeyamensis]
MKRSHIFGLIIIAIMISILVVTAGDASQYVDFTTAQEIAADGNENKVHVIGELQKDKSGNVIGIQYDPMKDANYLAFNLVDEQNVMRRVVCYSPPASMKDFEKSEKVVVIGRTKNEQEFLASEILMKCPSKYEEKQL